MTTDLVPVSRNPPATRSETTRYLLVEVPTCLRNGLPWTPVSAWQPLVLNGEPPGDVRYLAIDVEVPVPDGETSRFRVGITGEELANSLVIRRPWHTPVVVDPPGIELGRASTEPQQNVVNISPVLERPDAKVKIERDGYGKIKSAEIVSAGGD